MHKVMSDSPKYAYEKAAELKLNVVESSDKVLFIDLDSAEAETHFKAQLLVLQENCPKIVKDYIYTTSKGGNTHVYMRLTKSLSLTHRIGLQAALGSDPKREILSFAAAFNNEPTVSVLFETNDQLDILLSNKLLKYKAE